MLFFLLKNSRPEAIIWGFFKFKQGIVNLGNASKTMHLNAVFEDSHFFGTQTVAPRVVFVSAILAAK